MSVQRQCAVIICGFVCIGKTYLAQNWPRHKVYDMEAVRNDEGLDHERYLARIKTLATSEPSAIILVGTQRGARQRLQREGLAYVRVYPSPLMHVEAWLWRQRGKAGAAGGEAAEMLLRQRWGDWVWEARLDFPGETCTKRIELGRGGFLEDEVPGIVRWFEKNVFV